MVLRTITEWKNGVRQEFHVNTDASRGRYLLNSIGAYPHMNMRKVKNGFQYDTTSANGGPCTTTVTLERGWAA